MKSYKIEEVILVTVCLVTLVGGLIINNQVFSFAMIGLLILCSIFILGRHLSDFANISPDNPKVKTMRFINWFTIGFVILGVVISQIFEKQVLTHLQERWISLILVTLLMVVIGNFAPQLPFNRYIGLRLPWTVRDEETWILAHRVLGYVTFPLVVCFIVLNQFIALQTCIAATLLAWIIIPGIISGVFFLKKYR